jgi:hypothetical protein
MFPEKILKIGVITINYNLAEEKNVRVYRHTKNEG